MATKRRETPKETVPPPAEGIMDKVLPGHTPSTPEAQPSGDTASHTDGEPEGQKDGDMVKVTYRLPADLVRRLRHAYAEQSTTQERRTMSDMVAEALQRYLAAEG